MMNPYKPTENMKLALKLKAIPLLYMSDLIIMRKTKIMVLISISDTSIDKCYFSFSRNGIVKKSRKYKVL